MSLFSRLFSRNPPQTDVRALGVCIGYSKTTIATAIAKKEVSSYRRGFSIEVDSENWINEVVSKVLYYRPTAVMVGLKTSVLWTKGEWNKLTDLLNQVHLQHTLILTDRMALIVLLADHAALMRAKESPFFKRELPKIASFHADRQESESLFAEALAGYGFIVHMDEDLWSMHT